MCAKIEFGRVFTRAPKPASPNIVPMPSPDGDADGRRLVGVNIDGEIRRGFPTPSGRLEFFSRTLVDWGWQEFAIPTYIESHVHPENLEDDQTILISTFRLAIQIHTRSANAKWLNEIAHTNPLWIHPSHAAKLGVRTGDLVRVETEIGYFVVPAWVTEGIRAGHRRVQSSHGSLENSREWAATDDGDGETGPRWNEVGFETRAGVGAVRIERS